MKVVLKNAEQSLIETAKAYWHENTGHRCLYLRFSQITNLAPDQWLPLLTSTFEKYFYDEEASVFICEDRDVFILSRSLCEKATLRLLTHLAPKLAPAPLEELAHLFELKTGLSKLNKICERKIEETEIKKQSMQKAAESKKDKLAPAGKSETLDMMVNEAMSNTIQERREKRAHPEIMIVEDDTFSRRLIRNALGKNISTSESEDGQAAIATYLQKAPDVLFLDIGLPDITGHEVLQKILDIDPDAYIVMLSGYGNKENITKAIQNGAKGFVGKPFTKEKLLQYVERSPFIQEKTKKESIHGNVVV